MGTANHSLTPITNVLQIPLPIMKSNNRLDACARKVLRRMTVFALVYLLLVLLGIALLVGSYFWATRWGLGILQASLLSHSGAAIAIVFCLYIGVILLSLAFGFYLVKYIFAQHDDEDATRIEVTESDCPRLFQLIYETADAVKAPRPYKVFLNPEVNARVFFNTSFWSMFLPVKKNLVFGLGLLVTANTEEVRTILAHEFGHFSQDSMRVGETVYIGNNIMWNLAFKTDYWDRWIDRWADETWWFFAIFGKMTRWLAGKVARLLQCLYGYVNVPYMELSRQQEYDADRQADCYVGKAATESALIKTDIIAGIDSKPIVCLQKLATETRKAAPFELLELIIQRECQERQIAISALGLLRADDLPAEPVSNRFTYDELWNSHPTTKERIHHLHNTHPTTRRPAEVAWTLVPQTVKEQVEALVFDWFGEDTTDWPQLKGDELNAWLRHYLDTEWLKPLYCDFFTKHNCLDFFNPANDVFEGEKAFPFTEENRKTVLTYVRGHEDIGAMQEVVDGQKAVGATYYDGKLCPIGQLPIAQARKEMEALRPKMKQIYAQIAAWLCTREESVPLYEAFFRLDRLDRECCETVIEPGNDIIDEWNNSRKKKADVRRIAQKLAEFSRNIVHVIDQLTEEDKENCDDKDNLQALLDFSAWMQKVTDKMLEDLEELTYAYHTRDILMDVLSDIQGSNKLNLGMLAQRIARE